MITPEIATLRGDRLASFLADCLTTAAHPSVEASSSSRISRFG